MNLSRLRYISIMLIAIILIIVLYDYVFKNFYTSEKLEGSKEYIELLSKFPKDKQGNSLEPVLEPRGPSDQPMTYGLVLSSEAIHYKWIPNDESYERVKNAVKWLVDNSDLNEDGNPGWGLPQAWDAFSDGTINPENHPYTITTAIVLEGLLDALSIENFWTEKEEREIKKLIADVILYWLKNVYKGNETMGYLGYSEEPTDMFYTPNVSGMFLSSIVRALEEQDGIFEESEKEFIMGRTHAIMNQLVNTVQLDNGVPYWEYGDNPNVYKTPRPNDLVHHVYILWGIEEYRKYFDKVEIPFNIEESLQSLDYFWKEDKILLLPQNNGQINTNENPANLWGVGMMLAFYAKYGEYEKADKVIEVINRDYGPIPELKMWPRYFSSEDNNFYERYAAHVLLGLSYRDYYQN